MIGIIATCLRIRTIVVAVAVAVLAGGLWQMRQMTLDVIPEFSPLSLQVRTEALGLSAAEVESLITVPMEADLLNGVPWLQSIESESLTGVSSIEMFFAPGTDLMHARQMVQERLTQAHALPNVSTPPVMLQPISTANRVMNIGMSSKTVSLIEMSVQAKWTIVPRLVGVPGVANVSVWGMRDRQLQVRVDPKKLSAKGVTLEQVVKTSGEAVWASPLTYLNSSTPGTGGFIDTPNQRLNVRHVFPISTATDFAKIPVHGTSFALGEVADVIEAHQPLIGDAMLETGPGLLLVVEKFPGFNTMEVTRGVEAAMAELHAGMTGIDVDTTIYRPASFVERATGNLASALTAAAVLAVVALLLLLGNWRTALIGTSAIVLSLVTAGLVFHWRGVTFNMMVVTGLLLSIAVVVDDAIVDAENILRRLREGAAANTGTVWSRIAAAALEVRGPTMYATLIIVLAVVPVLFLQGLSAAFFQPLVLSYVVAIVASLIVAMTVTPALTILLLGNAPLSENPESPIMRGLLVLYDGVAGRLIRSPIPATVLAAAGILLAFFVWSTRERAMVPEFKETDVVVEWQGPPGASLPAMNRVTEGLMAELRKIPGVRNLATQTGRALLTHDVADVNSAQVWVSITPTADYEKTLAAIRQTATTYPGVAGQVLAPISQKIREALTGSDEAISVRLYGHDLGIIRGKAEEIRQVLSKIDGIKRPRVEQQAEQSTIEVEVDLDRAREHGLKPGDVRRAASALLSGIKVGSLFQEQKIFDVVVWGTADVRGNVADIQNLMIDVESGSQVRLGDVAQVRVVNAPGAIRRQGVSRRIDIEAEVSGRSLTAVTADVARRIKDIALPFEYHAQVRGEAIERNAAVGSLYSYVVASAIIIFLLLQAALGSWRLAALSVVGIPVAALGGLVSLYLSSEIFSLGSLLGFVAVLGLATRNGIMTICHLQDLSLQERNVSETLVISGTRDRVPAVLGAAITIALFMLPFAVMGNIAGLEIAHPAAMVILGGLVTTTLLTLFVLPAIYLRATATGFARVPAPALQAEPVL